MKRFKVAQCPKCGRIQITQAQRFRCVRCKKTAKFEKVKFRDFNYFVEAKEWKKLWQEKKYGKFPMEIG